LNQERDGCEENAAVTISNLEADLYWHSKPNIWRRTYKRDQEIKASEHAQTKAAADVPVVLPVHYQNGKNIINHSTC
jgi:hypothetical protein